MDKIDIFIEELAQVESNSILGFHWFDATD